MPTRRLVPCLLAVGLLTPPTFAASTYYLSPLGTHPAAGTVPVCSQSAPCRDLPDVYDGLLPGVTVHFAPGTYQHMFLEKVRGTSSAPITLVGDGPGVVIQGVNNQLSQYVGIRGAIYLRGSTYITLRRLEVYNSTGSQNAGVAARYCHNILIDGCRIGHNSEFGVLTSFSDDVTVSNCEIFGTQNQHGIYFANSGDRPVAANNWIHDNKVLGIHVNADASTGPDSNYLDTASAFDGVTTGADIEGNIVWGDVNGVDFDGVQGFTLKSNLIGHFAQKGGIVFQQNGAVASGPGTIEQNIFDSDPTSTNGAIRIAAHTGPITVDHNAIVHRNPSRGAGLAYLFDSTAGASDVHASHDIVGLTGTSSQLASWRSLQANYGVDPDALLIPHIENAFTKPYTGTNSGTVDYHPKAGFAFPAGYVGPPTVVFSVAPATYPAPLPDPAPAPAGPAPHAPRGYGSPPPPSNLIPNPSFESGTGTPTDWTFYNVPNATWTRTTPGEDGDTAMTLTMMGSTPFRSGNLKSILFPLGASRSVTLSAWFKSTDVRGTYPMILFVAETDAGGKVLLNAHGNAVQHGLLGPFGTMPWIERSLTFTTDPRCAQAFVYANGYTTLGTMGIDALTLH